MVRAAVNGGDEGTIIDAELLDHLGDARDVVVAAADEGD